MPLQVTSSSANEKCNFEAERGIKMVSPFAIISFVWHIPGIQSKHCEHTISC